MCIRDSILRGLPSVVHCNSEAVPAAVALAAAVNENEAWVGLEPAKAARAEAREGVGDSRRWGRR
eukprot:9519306-Alexandrium_andersonii.AAC.1